MADEWTWEPVDNDTAKWQLLDVSGVASADGSVVPYALLINRFKSSSPDSEAFIHDPMAEFARAAEDEGIEAFKGIDDSWHMNTLVSNHEATLSASHVYVVVAVHTIAKIVSVTTVKQRND